MVQERYELIFKLYIKAPLFTNKRLVIFIPHELNEPSPKSLDFESHSKGALHT